MSKSTALHKRACQSGSADMLAKLVEMVSSCEGRTPWKELWALEVIPWHVEERCNFLIKHHDRLLAGKGKDTTVLIPLCGKCVDMKWMYDEGYRVIGIDMAELGARQFFDEQQLKYQVVPKPEVDGFLYQTPDERLKIYVCNFFNLNKSIVGQVDVVFDRAAFGSVSKDKRKKYVELMKSLLAVDFRYLLVVFHYDDWYYPISPHNTAVGVIKELFGTFCTIEEDGERADFTEAFFDMMHVKPIEEVAYFLSPK